MLKNVANQHVKVQLNDASGAAVTAGTTTVYVSGDDGSQSAGGGTVTHLGNGCWRYTPTQAETNFDNVAFTFVNASAVPVTINLDTADPTQNVISSGAISTVAYAFEELNGTAVVNDYTVTKTLDGVYHRIDPDSGGIHGRYYFNVGTDGVPVSLLWNGYFQSQNDNLVFRLYNWTTIEYDQQASLVGSNGVNNTEVSIEATTQHVGSGANDGIVILEVESTDGTRLATDRILCGYTVIPLSQGYEGGFVWVDENNGTSTGTTPGQDGIITNRSNSYENAQTIMEALGYHKLGITNGNNIQLTQAISNTIIGVPGANWSLDLNGQSIANCDVNDANVIGECAGANPHFHNCLLGAVTLPPGEFFRCGFGYSDGTFTAKSAGYYRIIDGYTDRNNGSVVNFDLGSIGGVILNMHRWAGGAQFLNMTAGDFVEIFAVAGCTITVNGDGGTISIVGPFEGLVDNSNGAVTIIKKGMQISIGEGIIIGAAQAGTLSTTQASTNLTGYGLNQLNGSVIIWLDGDCEGERSRISANTAGGLLTFSQLTTAPAAGDRFKIV